MVRSISLGLILIFAASISLADVITSAPGGGPWSYGSSWVGGQVPGADDDVIIVSTIDVTGEVECRGLNIFTTGILKGSGSGYGTVIAGGDAFNEGTVQDGVYWFTVRVGGDLVNHGNWMNHYTYLQGSETRILSMTESAYLSTQLAIDDGASGDLVTGSPIEISGGIDLNGSRMILEPGHNLHLDACAFQGGELLCNNNEVSVESWSYFAWSVLDAAVLVGEVEMDTGVHFTGGLTVMGVLQNLSAHSGLVQVEGGLVNKGLITNNSSYGWSMELSGDLQNDGTISNSMVALDGQSEHHLSGGPACVFDAPMFLPEFQGGTIVADSDLHFTDGLSLAGGEMHLEPGVTLNFTSWGSMGSGTLYANGNTIHMDGYACTLGDIVVDQAVLSGLVRVNSPVSFTGGLTNEGILENREYFDQDISVEGLFLNEGTVRNQIKDLTVRLLGDFENRGAVTCEQLTAEGYADQHIGVGSGIDAAEVIFVSHLPSGPYQWYRDGAPLDGETAATLSFAGLHSGDYGHYHCESGGDLSRQIIVSEYVDPTSVETVPMGVVLEPNHPNPFNPATTIAFSLPADGPVRLAVYDAAGRLSDLLLDEFMAAGRHSLLWQAGDRASGLYFYRLSYGGVEQVGKAVLVK